MRSRFDALLERLRRDIVDVLDEAVRERGPATGFTSAEIEKIIWVF